jgi:hypothetical protein
MLIMFALKIQDIDRWDKTIRLHPDYAKEQEDRAKKWEADNLAANTDALRLLRALVPPHVGTSSVAEVCNQRMQHASSTTSQLHDIL